MKLRSKASVGVLATILCTFMVFRVDRGKHDLSSFMPSPCPPHTNYCFSKFTTELQPSLAKESNRDGICSFLDQHLQDSDCDIEADTVASVAAVITPQDVVIEFGGRYAFTTCHLARAQNNSGKLVSVEPDPRVWTVHSVNMYTHNCAGSTLYGVVSEQDLNVVFSTEGGGDYNRHRGYNTYTSESGDGVRIGHLTWDQVARHSDLKFNSIVFDCEGCYVPFLREYKEQVQAMDKIILEYDLMPGQYGDRWRATLETMAVIQEGGILHIFGDKGCIDNLVIEENEMEGNHSVACQYVLLRKVTKEQEVSLAKVSYREWKPREGVTLRHILTTCKNCNDT